MRRQPYVSPASPLLSALKFGRKSGRHPCQPYESSAFYARECTPERMRIQGRIPRKGLTGLTMHSKRPQARAGGGVGRQPSVGDRGLTQSVFRGDRRESGSCDKMASNRR